MKKDAVKWFFIITIGFLTIVLLVMSISALGPITAEQMWMLLILFGILGTFLLAYYWPWKKLVKRPKNYMKHMRDMIVQCCEEGLMMPASLEDGKLIERPSYDICVPIGEYLYMRFKDVSGLTRNILYNTVDRVLIGEIRGSKLNAIPEEAVKEATKIVGYIKTGKVPEVALTPAIVREVYEREKKEEAKPVEEKR